MQAFGVRGFRRVNTGVIKWKKTDTAISRGRLLKRRRMRALAEVFHKLVQSDDRRDAAPVASTVPYSKSEGPAANVITSDRGHRHRMRLCRSESSHARIRCIDRWQSRSLFKINIADPRYGIVAASACLLFSDSSDQHFGISYLQWRILCRFWLSASLRRSGGFVFALSSPLHRYGRLR